MHKYVRHTWVNHSLEYSAGDGFTHTNTIEGFWGLVKRAWYGTHHHYSVKYAPVYLAESCFKYNVRRDPNAFGRLLNLMVGV